MTLLLSDPRVTSVPVLDNGDPLVRLDPQFGPARAAVRSGLADRLEQAATTLPAGVRLRVVEGHRSVADQRAIITVYTDYLRTIHPGLAADQLAALVSRFVAPVAVAPHVAGAAVDLTLTDTDGHPLDLGCPIDATPEQSAGACYFAAPVSAAARAYRDLLAHALEGAGLVNYPTEWWHWSFGDRYWSIVHGGPAALYGPVVSMELAA